MHRLESRRCPAFGFRFTAPLLAVILFLLTPLVGTAEGLTSEATGAYEQARRSLAAGDERGAIEHLQRAQQALERSRGPEHASVADVLQDLGSLHARLGNSALAVQLLTRCIQIREQLGHAPSRLQAGAWQTLGAMYVRTGQDSLAVEALERSLAIGRQIGLAEADQAATLSALGVALSTHGRHDEALALYEQVRVMLERLPGEGGTPMASLLNNVATAQVRRGAYGQALAPLQRALALWEANSGPGSLEVAGALNNLAELHVRLGEPAQARALHERSLAIRVRSLPPAHAELLSSRNNLALTLHALGDTQGAATQLRAALAAVEQEPDSPMAAAIYNSLAWTEARDGRRDQAIQLQRRVLEMARRRADTRPVEFEVSVRNLAALQLNADAPLADSLELLREALDAAGPEQLEDGGAQTRHWLSVAHAKAGRVDQAVFWGKLAVNAVQQQRRRLHDLTRPQQAGFLSLMPDIHGHLAGLLLSQNRVAEAQQILQMLKEHEQSQLISRTGAADPRLTSLPLDDREQALFNEYAELQARLSTTWRERLSRQRGTQPGSLIALPEEMAQLHQSRSRFLAALDHRLTESKVHRWALPPGAVQLRLRTTLELLGREAPDSRPAALQYVLSGPDLYILLSSPDAPPLVRRVEAVASLASTVAQTRLLLASPTSELAGLQARLKSLHDVLVAPVREELARRQVRTLMISANGELRYLPWAALYDGQRYLIQDFAISGFHEGVDNPFAGPPTGSWQLAGLGLSQATQGLPALEQVPAELDGLLRVPGVKGQVWMNSEFTRARLRQVLADPYNALHVASHFRFVHGSADQSSLFLGDGTRLSLADIEREDLLFSRLDLLVLSACETGVGGGHDRDGREIDGLGGLVQRRGARAVLMTLWHVSDEEMPMLVRAFYRRLAAGANKAEALRMAQVGMLTRSLPGERVPERARHPFFWAPMLMSGNWR